MKIRSSERARLCSAEGLLTAKRFKKTELVSFFKNCLKSSSASVQSSKALESAMAVMAFFEPSTRTEVSFEAAGLEVGLKWIKLKPESLSLQKGETLKDTFEVVKSSGPDLIVVRHKNAYAPHWIQQWTRIPVLNAGDGQNEHPTQALLDGLSLFEKFGISRKLKIGFFGDMVRSRVARSLVYVLKELGHSIYGMEDGSFSTDLFIKAFKLKSFSRSQLKNLDVVYALRAQSERGTETAMSPLRADEIHPRSTLMHPGPVIWGRDLAYELKEDPRSLILRQVENGKVVRREIIREILEMRTKNK